MNEMLNHVQRLFSFSVLAIFVATHKKLAKILVKKHLTSDRLTLVSVTCTAGNGSAGINGEMQNG
jgi:hypothetical protein